MAGAGAQRSGRFQSASLAVMATMVAMILALGTSVVVSDRTARSERTALAQTAAESSSTPSDIGAADSAGARSGRPRRAPQSSTADAAAPDQAPDASGLPSDAPTGDAAGTPSTAVDATGDGAAAAPSSEAVSYSTAAAGRWRLRTATTSPGLLGESAPQRTEGAFLVDGAEDARQRVRLESGPLALIDEDVSYLDGSRRLARIVVWTGSGEARTFVAPSADFLDLPASFRAGETWEWGATTADGLTTVLSRVELIERSSMRVGGDHETETIQSVVTMTFSGDRTGTLVRRVWFSPTLGLAVRVEEDLDVQHADGPAGRQSAIAELVDVAPEPAPVLPPTTTTTTPADGGQPEG